jgi:hypothetical protein
MKCEKVNKLTGEICGYEWERRATSKGLWACCPKCHRLTKIIIENTTQT